LPGPPGDTASTALTIDAHLHERPQSDPARAKAVGGSATFAGDTERDGWRVRHAKNRNGRSRSARITSEKRPAHAAGHGCRVPVFNLTNMEQGLASRRGFTSVMMETPGLVDPRIYPVPATAEMKKPCIERFEAIGPASHADCIRPIPLAEMAKRHGSGRLCPKLV
jgi:hypothetical protein